MKLCFSPTSRDAFCPVWQNKALNFVHRFSPPTQLPLVQQIHFFPRYIPHMLANIFKCVAASIIAIDVDWGGTTLHFTNTIACSFSSVEQPFSLLVPRCLLLSGFIINDQEEHHQAVHT